MKNKTREEIKEELSDKLGMRNYAWSIKSWGIARDLTKDIKRLRKELKEK